MKIAVDIDEVLADLLTEYITFLNVENDMPVSRSQFNGYYIWDGWTGTIQDKIALFESFYKSKYFENIRPVSKAVENIKKLKKNHKLIIVTSRPDYLKNQTILWLDKFFSNTFDDIYFASHVSNIKKSDICKSAGISLIIEDSLDYVMDCVDNGVKGVLISYPWNMSKRKHKNLTRVNSWSKIPKIIESMK